MVRRSSHLEVGGQTQMEGPQTQNNGLAGEKEEDKTRQIISDTKNFASGLDLQRKNCSAYLSVSVCDTFTLSLNPKFPKF